MMASFFKTLRLPAEASAQAGYVLARYESSCGRALILKKTVKVD
jgi:hypothetical protein